jgi:hypothetical protein
MGPAGSAATNAFQSRQQRAIRHRAAAQAVFHVGKSFPRDGFTVTNLETDSWAVVQFYNKGGAADGFGH